MAVAERLVTELVVQDRSGPVITEYSARLARAATQAKALALANAEAANAAAAAATPLRSAERALAEVARTADRLIGRYDLLARTQRELKAVEDSLDAARRRGQGGLDEGAGRMRQLERAAIGLYGRLEALRATNDNLAAGMSGIEAASRGMEAAIAMAAVLGAGSLRGLVAEMEALAAAQGRVSSSFPVPVASPGPAGSPPEQMGTAGRLPGEVGPAKDGGFLEGFTSAAENLLTFLDLAEHARGAMGNTAAAADTAAASVRGLGAAAGNGAAGLGSIALTGAGVAAVVAGGVLAYESYNASMRELEQASRVTGGSLGLTVEQMDRLARTSADAGSVSVSSARSMVAEYSRLGSIGPDTMRILIGMTRDYAALTGRDAADAARTLGELVRDPAKGAEELARSMQLLGGAELDHIKRLQEMGRHTEAQTVLLNTLGQRIKGAADQTSGWAQAWDWVKTSADDAVDSIGQALDELVDGEAIEKQITALQKKITQLESAPITSLWSNRPDLAHARQALENLQEHQRMVNAQAIQQKRIASNNEASRVAEELAAGFGTVAHRIREAEVELDKLNSGLKTGEMSPEAVTSATLKAESLTDLIKFLQQVPQGLEIATYKAQLLSEATAKAEGMGGAEGERFLAQERVRIELLDTLLPKQEKEARLAAALVQADTKAAEAAANVCGQLTLKASAQERVAAAQERSLAAQERLAVAAGKGDAAIRAATAENEVEEKVASGTDRGKAQAAAAAQEAIAVRKIRGEQSQPLLDQTRLQENLTAAYAKGPVAVQQVQLTEQARAMALKEGIEGTEKYNEAYAHYLRLLEQGAQAQLGAKLAEHGQKQDRQLALAQAELDLMGESEQVRERILGQMRLEAELRQQYPGIGEAELQGLLAKSEALAQTNQMIQRQKSVYDELEQIGNRAFDQLGSSISQAFSQGEGAAISFSDIAKGVLNDLMKLMIQLAIVNPLKNALSGGNDLPVFSDLLTIGGKFLAGIGGGSTGVSSTVSSTSLSNAPGGFGFASRYAEGGRVIGPGTGTSDSILAKISNGEFVVNAQATAQHLPLLEMINGGRLSKFSNGGLVFSSLPSFKSSQVLASADDNRKTGDVSVTIIDQRGAGAPAAKVSERSTENGRSIEVMIFDAVEGGILDGRFDGAMATAYGVRPAGQ